MSEGHELNMERLQLEDLTSKLGVQEVRYLLFGSLPPACMSVIQVGRQESQEDQEGILKAYSSDRKKPGRFEPVYHAGGECFPGQVLRSYLKGKAASDEEVLMKVGIQQGSTQQVLGLPRRALEITPRSDIATWFI